MLAIQIGPGRLTLGLLVPCVRAAGIDACLVGRPDGDPPLRQDYELASSDPEVGLSVRHVEHVANCDSLAGLPAQVQRRVRSSEPLLITCALGAGIADCTGLLDEIVAARDGDGETALVVCENAPEEPYRELERRHRGRIDFCWSVVDRVCTWASGQTERRRVRANAVGEWVIGHPEPGRSRLMAALAEVDEVAAVEPGRLPEHRDRKLWIVNGLHLVLALIVRRHYLDRDVGAGDSPEEPIPRDAMPLAARSEAFAAIAAKLLPLFEAALTARHPELEPDPAYAPRRVKVFTEEEDVVERILGSLLRADLAPFFERLDRRIFAAAEAAAGTGADLDVCRTVAELVLQLLQDPRCYYDDPSEIDPALDAAAVDRFAVAVGRWAGEPEREQYARRLAWILEADRDRRA